MRLLFLTQDFPPDIGGTQTYALELAQRLAPRCEDFLVLAPAVKGAGDADASLPFDVHRVASSYDSFSVRALPALWSLTASRGFDTAFAVQWSAAVSAYIARRLGWGCPYFLAAHGRELLFNPFKRFPLHSLYNRLRRRVLHGAEHLFPVSHYTGSLLADAGLPPERYTVLPNATDPTRFSPRDAAPLRRALHLEDRPVLLTICRLVDRKGIDTVLRALPALLAAQPRLLYLVGGTGPARPHLIQLARDLKVADHVRFLGRVPDADLAFYYSLAHVFVMPARHAPPDVEGFGLVFLEANACETPVVGAATGGIPDAIRAGETGFLVPPDDPACLATVLRDLLADPALAARLGRQGRQRVLRAASWDHVAAHLFEGLSTP